MITPRVISLDLDDTLWPVAPVIAAAEATLLKWLRTHHPRAAHGHDVDSMRAMRADIAARFPEHSHDMTFLRRQALVEQFAAANAVAAPGVAGSGGAAPGDQQCVDAAMEIFLGERNRVQFYEDARPALVRLRSKYRLFAVSNGNADLERCGIGDLFDGHVTAAAAGAAKPNARIFAHLVRVAGVEPIEVLHVGDDPLADVVGATQAGMQAAWLNREGREWPSQFAVPLRTISTLAEIL
ncbi:MAG: hydrolase / 5-amino-6-(5-phospho-D-ribitylamino)uracil phosphatase [Gammaproteobacteria bacterium]|nr:hydrolase / 5-amino-6-(5-phospho-D-ribitylamino)uracil phosphatase [Gammaproteobacteria bacterium]